MNGIGDGIEAAFVTLSVACIIFVPLGLWKLIDILIWLFSHLSWS